MSEILKNRVKRGNQSMVKSSRYFIIDKTMQNICETVNRSHIGIKTEEKGHHNDVIIKQ